MLKIKASTKGFTTSIVMAGRLDGVSTPQAQDHLDRLLADPAIKHVLFDLTELSYMSSMGLRLIMKATKEIHSRGGRCLISNLQPPVQMLLELAQALPSENIFSSYEEADAYLAKMMEKEGIVPGEGKANHKVVELHIGKEV